MFRKLKSIPNIGFRCLNYLFQPIDRKISHFFVNDMITPPIFIIGPPRSGSTLLYQTLVSRFEVAYFSNFSSKLYRLPTISSLLSKHLIKHMCEDNYCSYHGRTSGLLGPHECGIYWYQWFPKGMHVYVSPNNTSDKHLKELRRSVQCMSSAANKPILFKNMYCCMRIAPIMEAFPEAMFIVCKRNPVDIAQSLLNTRLKVYGNKDKFWSIPPKEIDEIIDEPYWEQIVDQIYYIYKQIAEDKKRYGEQHFFEVNYEDLCSDTHATLDKIESFLQSKRYNLEKKGEVPESFPLSSGIKVDEEDYKLLMREIEKRDWKFG